MRKFLFLTFILLASLLGLVACNQKEGVILKVYQDDNNNIIVEYDDGKSINLNEYSENVKDIKIEGGNLVVDYISGEQENLGSLIGFNGKDGKEVVLETDDAYIRWKYSDSEEWVNLISLDLLKGKDGEQGESGKDGVSITEVYFNDNNELIIKLSNTEEINLGNISGQNGVQGEPGSDGDDGFDGDSAYDLFVKYNPEYEGTEEEWILDLVEGNFIKKQYHTVKFMKGDKLYKEELVLHGEKVTRPEDPVKLGYTFKHWHLGFEKWSFIGYIVTEDIILEALFEYEEFELPILTIDTLDGGFPVDKVNYLDAKVSLFNTDEQFELDSVDSGVRLRGNSSMGLAKKPFRLKFDKRQGLFGLERQKKWNLIANHSDKTLMRNFLAYNSFGTLVEDQFVPSTIFVDVYFNGEYMGVYMLTEQAEVKAGRVDIESEVDVLDTGYLIEMDVRAPSEGIEGIDFFYSNGHAFEIDSPRPKDGATTEQLNFIKQFIDDVFLALDEKDVNLIEELIDVETFIKYFLIQELFKNVDVGQSSVKMYKEKGGKLVMGPIWDFDIAIGNANYIDYSPNGLWAESKNPMFSRFMKIEEFRNLYIDYYNDNIDLIFDFIVLEMNKTYKDNYNSFNRNFDRWDVLDKYVWPNPEEVVLLDSIEKQIEYVYEFLEGRIEYLNGYYNE